VPHATAQSRATIGPPEPRTCIASQAGLQASIDAACSREGREWDLRAVGRGGLRVVAPSLTPESYNFDPTESDTSIVVAPSLTPESYNAAVSHGAGSMVVAPSLTPESYNLGHILDNTALVVAPSLTPESYNPKQKTPCFYKEFFVLDYAKMTFSEQ
jgi:hypothetical protein